MRTPSLRKIVVVVVGMPGAGKSLASKAAKEMGIPVLVSGTVIREEARRLGLRPDKENLGRLMLKIRAEEGMGAVARRLKPMVDRIEKPCIVYEGARNPEEVDELARDYRVVTIAIHASPETRLGRLLRRRRGDRPKSRSDFVERDERELKVGVGKVIALADRMLENEDTRDTLKRNMKRLLKTLIVLETSMSPSTRRSGLLKTLRK